MVIKIKDYVVNGSTNSDGDIIFKIIVQNYKIENFIDISFEGMGAVSSSFINSAFVQLLELYSFSEIKTKLKFTNTLKVHNDLIKSRFYFEEEKRLAAHS